MFDTPEELQLRAAKMKKNYTLFLKTGSTYFYARCGDGLKEGAVKSSRPEWLTAIFEADFCHCDNCRERRENMKYDERYNPTESGYIWFKKTGK